MTRPDGPVWPPLLIRVPAAGLVLACCLFLLAAAGPSPVPGSAVPVASGPAPSVSAGPRPLVFAYYYIWYSPTSWLRAKTDFPRLGRYDSADRAVVAQQMAWIKQAGIDGLIVSWKHEPRLDAALAVVVDEATRAGVKLIILYEGLDFDRNPLPAPRIAADVNWFLQTYGALPAFNVFGLPTVVWSGTWGYTDTQIASVRAAIGAPGRALLLGSEKSADAYAARARLFDGNAYYWSSPDPLSTPGYAARLQAMAKAVRSANGRWIAPAAPGFDARLVGGTSTVPRRDGATFRAAWAGALATRPDILGIISWNEFSENSQIEPSTTYGDLYLRIASQLVASLPPASLGSTPASRAPDPFSSSGPIATTPGSVLPLTTSATPGQATVAVIVGGTIILVVAAALTARLRKRR